MTGQQYDTGARDSAKAAYELAAQRWDSASRRLHEDRAKARQMIEAAEREWDDAEAGLRELEAAPGIPLYVITPGCSTPALHRTGRCACQLQPRIPGPLR